MKAYVAEQLRAVQDLAYGCKHPKPLVCLHFDGILAANHPGGARGHQGSALRTL